MNNTALAIIQPDELETIQRTAKLLAASGYFGAADGITGMAQVAAKIMAGRELGFGPFASVNGIHIIQGKPTVGANLMAAAVRAHPRYDYQVKELSDTVCELEFFDNGKSAGFSRFTKADAEAAELSTGKNGATWKKFARNMLFARAMSNGVRWYAPDIFSGNAVYVPEEMGANVDGEGNVIDVQPTQKAPVESNGTNGHNHTAVVEIIQPEPENPFEDTDEGAETAHRGTHPLASQSQLNRMHALGMAYYRTKENWDKKRPEWVREASGGAVTSSKDLTPEQIDWVITLLDSRIAKRKAQETEQPVAA